MLGQVQELGSGPSHGSQRATGKGASQSPLPGCFQRPHGGGPPTVPIWDGLTSRGSMGLRPGAVF